METFGNSNVSSTETSTPSGQFGNSANADAHAKIDKVSSVARTTVDSLSAGAHQGFDKAVEATSQAVETFDAKREQLKAAQEKLAENCRNYVQENPLTSLGIATAVGYVFSRFIKSH